jgi:tripartite-type tricarboxylate transporter receptor subunit TctC
MTNRRRDRRTPAMIGGAALGLGIAAAAFAPPAWSAEWPQQPIRIIVPFSTGGGTDIQARLLADSFHRSTRQTFIVDNRPGASGLIGAQITVDAPADGNTILFTTATLVINPTLYGKRWTVQPVKDLAPQREIAKYAGVIHRADVRLQ